MALTEEIKWLADRLGWVEDQITRMDTNRRQDHVGLIQDHEAKQHSLDHQEAHRRNDEKIEDINGMIQRHLRRSKHLRDEHHTGETHRYVQVEKDEQDPNPSSYTYRPEETHNTHIYVPYGFEIIPHSTIPIRRKT